MAILRFKSHCAASYGPKVEQPNVLLTRRLAQAKPFEEENMIDTFDTY